MRSILRLTSAGLMRIVLSALLLAAALGSVGRGARADDGLRPSTEGASRVRTDDVPEIGVPEPRESALFSIDSPVGAIRWQPGRGVRVGDTGLNVGAFTTFEYEREEGENGELALDAVNFLALFQPYEFFRVFAELEVDDLFSYEIRGGSPDSDAELSAERLFGELSLDDTLNVRFGKFQTPIGRWNLIKAEPFTWTADEPILVETAFDEHQTGVALLGAIDRPQGSIDYWLYGQVLDPLDPEHGSDELEPADHSVGGRLAFSRWSEGWSVGSSYLATEINGEWSHLAGIDAEWHLGPLELTSEAVYGNGEIGDRHLWDVYVQGVLEVLPKFYLVGRYEHYNPVGSADDANLGDVGFVWAPFEFLIFKATYRFADEQSDEVRRGVSTTLSVLF